MNSKQLLIYLDSSDYSSIAEHSGTGQPIDIVSSRLEHLSKSPSLIFTYSGIHISEMAPTESQHHKKAFARSKQLIRFCGNNALIPFNRLIDQEIRSLSGVSKEPITALSDKGEWFPEVRIPDPLEAFDLHEHLEKEAQARGLDRATKRHLMKQFNTKAKVRKYLNNLYFGDKEKFDYREWLHRLFPMSDNSFHTLLLYFCGRTTKSRARKAFTDCVKDPPTIARWFEHHADLMSPIVQLVREPSERYMKTIGMEVENLNHIYRLARSSDTQKTDFFKRKYWDKHANDTIEKIVRTRLRDWGIEANYSISDIEEYCPGITVSLRTAYSSLYESLGSNTRILSKSDAADFLHAAYAPYVDIFRTDTYMAPHIERNAKEYGTKVVRKLMKLPDEIEAMHNSA